MNTSRFTVLLFLGFTLAASAAPYRPDFSKKLGFPIYTNQPAGNTLENDPVRRAAREPQLHPLESQRKIKLPTGFEARLFASEPEVVNPVAMTWDDRGRLWVVELYEYPKGAKKGEKGRDRIKILEDIDADGTADKVTVFAEGFSLATGIALGNGGVYLGQAPDLLFLEDTNGDDKADKTTKLLTGFGLEDRHELLNGFAWGPDGWLYMTHGVFTHSKVRDPNAHDPDGFGVQMDAALARFNPKTKKFEVFSDGTSNPWGVDWNERGDAFVSACVIQHLFHMAPGGQYNRQGGTWANPYGYVGDLPSKGLPAIVNFRHYRAAHSGICIYQGDQWPAEWRGLVFLGNIHQNSLNCDRLTPVGSTYKGEKESKLLGPSKGDHDVGAGNFLISDDPWFRPVSNQTGPDGAMWIADWSDKYPCYQNALADPEGVDREMGRIWRVVWVGEEKGKAVASRPQKKLDLKEASNTQLSEALSHSNIWHRRQAQRILTERSDKPGFSVQYAPRNVEGRRQTVWAMSSKTGSNFGHIWSDEPEPELRSWSARIIGNDRNGDGDSVEAINVQKEDLKALQKLSEDADPYVRASVAVALRQFLSGSLTVNTPPRFSAEQIDLLPHFRELLARPSVDGDLYYPHIVWMAMEPRVAADPRHFFPLVGANENSVSAHCAHRVMRRICDLSNTAARASR
jgi:putative membrane-bound dehydrogenase-like protein